MTQEQEREEVRYPRYRWALLFMGWAILCLTAYNHAMQNVRYELRELAPIGLGLSTQEFYLCITATGVSAIPFALISGFMTDKMGVKRVILYGSIVTAIAGILRIFATGFADMFIYCVFMGVGLGIVGGNVPKLVGAWFPVRQIYMGIALFTTSLGIGPFLALATGRIWPTYTIGFIVMGCALLAMCVVWGIWARERPKTYLDQGRTIINIPFKESMAAVFKNKYIWLISAPYCLVAGVVASWTAGVPLSLVLTRDVPASIAGLVISLSVVGYIIGIVLWTWVAEKIGRMKPIFVICMCLSGTTGLLTYTTSPGIGMWLLGIFPGLFMGAGYPLVMQMPLRMKGIGTRYAGAAMGKIGMWGHVLGLTMLPFMFTPIWHAFGPMYSAWFLCVSLWVAGAIFLFFAPELGRKYMIKMLTEAAAKAAEAKKAAPASS